MSSGDERSGTPCPLVAKPINLTEREIEHCEALAEVLYSMFTRQQQAMPEPVMSIDNALVFPRVFAPASTGMN